MSMPLRLGEPLGPGSSEVELGRSIVLTMIVLGTETTGPPLPLVPLTSRHHRLQKEFG